MRTLRFVTIVPLLGIVILGLLSANLSGLSSAQSPVVNGEIIWTVMSTPVQNEASALEEIDMLSPNDGWAVGWMGTILHWDSISWTKVPSPVGYDLFSISMISSTDGWIVGAGGAILRWNGTSWNQVAYPTGMKGILRSVYMISSNDGWAVGGTLSTLQEILHWNGTSWVLFQQTNQPALKSVFMTNATDGWAVGESGTILRWDGFSWSNIVTPANNQLSSICMLNNNGWTVGAPSPFSNSSTALQWNGAFWTPIQTPTNDNLESVFLTSPSDGWAVGEDILHWDGTNWNTITDPLSAGTYRSVFPIDSSEGWVVGSEWVEVAPSNLEQRPRILHFTIQNPLPSQTPASTSTPTSNPTPTTPAPTSTATAEQSPTLTPIQSPTIEPIPTEIVNPTSTNRTIQQEIGNSSQKAGLSPATLIAIATAVAAVVIVAIVLLRVNKKGK